VAGYGEQHARLTLNEMRNGRVKEGELGKGRYKHSFLSVLSGFKIPEREQKGRKRQIMSSL